MANNLFSPIQPATASLSENPILFSVQQTFPSYLYTSQSAQFNLTVNVWDGGKDGTYTPGPTNLETYHLASIPPQPTTENTAPDAMFDLSPIIDSFTQGSLPLQAGIDGSSVSQGVWYQVEYSGSYIDPTTNARTYIPGGQDIIRWAQQGYIVNSAYNTDKPYQWSWSTSGVQFPLLSATPYNINGDTSQYYNDNYFLQRDNWKWKDWMPVPLQLGPTGETVYSPLPPDYENSFTYDANDYNLRILTSNGYNLAIPLSSPSNSGGITWSQNKTYWFSGTPGSEWGDAIVPYYNTSDFIFIWIADKATGSQYSDIIRINNRCPQKNEVPQRIYYRNRVGVMDWFDFPGYSKESFEVTRDLFNKSRLANSQTGRINKYDGDTNVYSVNGYNTIQLNTGFLREWDKERLQEILVSDEIYLYMLDLQYVSSESTYIDMPLQPLSIVDSSIQFKSDREDKVQQNYTLTFRYDQKHKTSF